MPGYIYLIQMADGVYKVGRTQQEYGTHLKRLKSYPADSSIVYTRKVQGDVVCIEHRIIETFRKKFGKHPRGNEYFIGRESEMIDIIHAEIGDENHPLKRFIKSNEVILAPSRSCPQIVFVRRFNQWCRRNEIGPFKFDEAFYQGVFSQYDVTIRVDSCVWNGDWCNRCPFVFGLDLSRLVDSVWTP
jgi:hypothetical protein